MLSPATKTREVLIQPCSALRIAGHTSVHPAPPTAEQASYSRPTGPSCRVPRAPSGRSQALTAALWWPRTKCLHVSHQPCGLQGWATMHQRLGVCRAATARGARACRDHRSAGTLIGPPRARPTPPRRSTPHGRPDTSRAWPHVLRAGEPLTPRGLGYTRHASQCMTVDSTTNLARGLARTYAGLWAGRRHTGPYRHRWPLGQRHATSICRTRGRDSFRAPASIP